MNDNFDIKKYLVENKATKNSRLLTERFALEPWAGDPDNVKVTKPFQVRSFRGSAVKLPNANGVYVLSLDKDFYETVYVGLATDFRQRFYKHVGPAGRPLDDATVKLTGAVGLLDLPNSGPERAFFNLFELGTGAIVPKEITHVRHLGDGKALLAAGMTPDQGKDLTDGIKDWLYDTLDFNTYLNDLWIMLYVTDGEVTPAQLEDELITAYKKVSGKMTNIQTPAKTVNTNLDQLDLFDKKYQTLSKPGDRELGIDRRFKVRK